jgi:hypothetical protein
MLDEGRLEGVQLARRAKLDPSHGETSVHLVASASIAIDVKAGLIPLSERGPHRVRIRANMQRLTARSGNRDIPVHKSTASV